MMLDNLSICYLKIFSKCIWQVVAVLGMLVYRFYGEELREMFGYEEHPYGFYTMASKSFCWDLVEYVLLHDNGCKDNLQFSS